MSALVRYCITLVLALLLMVGQGATVLASWAAACCGQPAIQAQQSCCSHGACQKHQALKTGILKAQNCYCAPVPLDLQQEQSSVLTDGGMLLVGNGNPNPALSLQVADSRAPIWLYRLFYPDRSRLYLEKNSWLL